MENKISHPHPEAPCYYSGTCVRSWILPAGTDQKSRWDLASSTAHRPESKKTNTNRMEIRASHKKRGETSYVQR
jgi:hypothetical protein